MKLSELWLREWIGPATSREEICERLTMSGLEVEEVAPVAEKFSGVVIGQVKRIDKHPEADRLQVCEVDTGGAEPLVIVCGAKNVYVGMKTAAALDGAQLANNLQIKSSKLRGVLSHGMLCSAKELGLAVESEGLFELPKDAPLGEDVWRYLHLTDHVIDLSITPNRGDCLSVSGLAREISAITKTNLTLPTIEKNSAKNQDKLAVNIHAKKECPRYVGRVIRNVTADAATPIWMQERLRRSGVRVISPVVDVMNYVMLELGQPMHAFDLAKIHNEIQVRMAKKGEQLELLDGSKAELTPETLIIADQQKPLAMAGLMGGMESAVTLLTKDVFLESAFFMPDAIAKMARQFKIGSESSYRFERGVDPALQVEAIERATHWITQICGGEPGPVIDVAEQNHLPGMKKINLRYERVNQILGIKLDVANIEEILHRLGFLAELAAKNTWTVTVPARRFDITREIDLIEEIIRLHGYEKIPTHKPIAELQVVPRLETKIALPTMRRALCSMGYCEVVTYSFIDKKIQQLFDPNAQVKELINPITSEMSVMRTTLWPGLINTLQFNLNRQQARARIFETGLRFFFRENELIQQPVISGLISGDVMPEQWGVSSRRVDFFDLKGDIENLFRMTISAQEFTFESCQHDALHPGQSSAIYRNGKFIGAIGALHPAIMQALDLKHPVFVFEILLDQLEMAKIPHYSEISRFPEIRRDIAILVDQAVPAKAISDTIKSVAGELLQDVMIFDVYQGKGIAPNLKSVALSLTLQHMTRTLVDDEVSSLVNRVCVALKDKFAAELRG